jgi:hypothetical protein
MDAESGGRHPSCFNWIHTTQTRINTIEYIDTEVVRIFATLRELNLADNTYVGVVIQPSLA